MKKSRSRLLLRYILILTTGVLLLPVLGCEPEFDLKVENGTDQVLTIYLDVSDIGKPVRQGDVEPGEHIYLHGLWLAEEPYEIIAKNKHEYVVYTREFGYFELRDDYNFEVVISELEDGLRNSENIAGSDNITGSDNTTIRQE